MMTVEHPDHTLREGYRTVQIIGLDAKPVICPECGYPNDPKLDNCHACGEGRG